MITKSIIIFIVGLLNIILGILILKKNSKNSSNIWYFYLCLFGGSWAVVKAFQISVLNLFLQDFVITKLIYLFGVLAPFSYLMFAYNFPYKLKVYSKKLLYLIYLIPAIFIVLNLIGILKKHNTYIINNLVQREVIFNEFLIFAIYFFIYVIFGFILLLAKYKKDSGIYRNQIKYLIIATLGTFITTGYVSIILLLFNNFTYDWLGALFLLIHFGVAGYLIFFKSLKNY